LRNRGALQDIDQHSILRSIVKSLHRVSKLKELGPDLQSQILLSLSEIPGPVFIECPVDLLYPETIVRQWYEKKTISKTSFKSRIIKWYIQRHLKKLFGGVNTTGLPGNTLNKPRIPLASAKEILDAAGFISHSQKPLLLIGSGAVMIPSEAGEVANAVKRMGIPVYLSGMARGLLGHHHSLHFYHQRKKALRESDCIILAGVPVDFRLDYGSHLNKQASVITISRSKDELRKNVKPALAVQSDAGRFLQALSKKIKPSDDWENWKQILASNENLRNQEIREMENQNQDDAINPLALFRRLENILPSNSVLIADGGDFAAISAYTLRPRKPLSWIDPGVFGTLGAGGGFALGAALCYPGDYIWIVYGDGSAAYSLMEFDTFSKMKLKVCAIIGNNGSWEQIARDQETFLESKTATQLPQSDYHLVAKAFGASGERLERIDDTEAAIMRAIEHMDRGIPYIINAIIGKSAFRQGSISM
jgi:thiamine pyrophosphate-dependent acetolactate synthase large subunit-like protein